MSLSLEMIEYQRARVRGGLVSLHAGDPGRDGAHELATGNGYARQRPRYKDIENGLDNTEQVRFAGLPRGPFTHVGFWSRQGQWLFGNSLDRTYTVQAGDEFYLDPGELCVYFLQVEGQG